MFVSFLLFFAFSKIIFSRPKKYLCFGFAFCVVGLQEEGEVGFCLFVCLLFFVFSKIIFSRPKKYLCFVLPSTLLGCKWRVR